MFVLKTFLVVTLCAAVVVGGVYFIRQRGAGAGGNGGIIPVMSVQEDTSETHTPNTPPSILIEVHEDRIMYNEYEISLEELEIVLFQFQNTEDIWELNDAFRANKSTFDDVRTLLRKHNITFVEN